MATEQGMRVRAMEMAIQSGWTGVATVRGAEMIYKFMLGGKDDPQFVAGYTAGLQDGKAEASAATAKYWGIRDGSKDGDPDFAEVDGDCPCETCQNDRASFARLGDKPDADPFKAPEGKAERLLKASIGQPQEMGAAEAEEVKLTEAMYKAGAAAIEEQRKALGEWARSDSVAAAIIFRAMYAKMQPAAPDPRIAKLERIASLARSIHDRVNDREFGRFVNHLRSEGWHEQVTSDLVDLRNLFANKPV